MKKTRLDVLDAMDQEMSDDDAPSQFNQDLTKKRKLFQEAEKKVIAFNKRRDRK